MVIKGYSVNIQVGVNLTGRNFGNTQRVGISGTVFNDPNNNGRSRP